MKKIMLHSVLIASLSIINIQVKEALSEGGTTSTPSPNPQMTFTPTTVGTNVPSTTPISATPTKIPEPKKTEKPREPLRTPRPEPTKLEVPKPAPTNLVDPKKTPEHDNEEMHDPIGTPTSGDDEPQDPSMVDPTLTPGNDEDEIGQPIEDVNPEDPEVIKACNDDSASLVKQIAQLDRVANKY